VAFCQKLFEAYDADGNNSINLQEFEELRVKLEFLTRFVGRSALVSGSFFESLK